MCMFGGSPSMPKIQAPAKPPEPPKPQDPSVTEASARERRRALLNSQDNRTGPGGVTTKAPTTKPALLGGTR